MNIKIVAALLFLFLSFSSYLKADGFYSYSIGQFDVNDTFDSLEARVEYLSNNNTLVANRGGYTNFSSQGTVNNDIIINYPPIA